MKKNIFLLLTVILLAGCSAEDTKEEPAAFAAVEKRDAVLTLPLTGKTEFNPHSVAEESAKIVLRAIYEPLFEINNEGVMQPVLAKSVVNRGMEADIYIRQNIKWHDGTDFTTDDVVYTISLITQGSSVYKSSVITGAYVRSKDSVTVSLSRTVSSPEELLTFPIVKNGSPLSMKYPAGTGEYAYVKKEGFDTYIFAPFSEYRKKSGKFEKIRLIAVKNHEREKELFKSGEADIMYVSNSELAAYSPRSKSKIYTYPTNHIIYIGFNTDKVPINVRKSIYYTVDRFKLTEDIFYHSAIAAAMPSMPKESQIRTNDCNLYLGEKELVKGGYIRQNNILTKDGKTVTYTVAYEKGMGHREVAEKISEYLSTVGINCIITGETDWDILNKNGDFDIFVGSCKPDSDFFDLLSEGNLFRYKDPFLKTIFSSPHTTTQINDIIVSYLPFIVVAYRLEAIAVCDSIGEAWEENSLLFSSATT